MSTRKPPAYEPGVTCCYKCKGPLRMDPKCRQLYCSNIDCVKYEAPHEHDRGDGTYESAPMPQSRAVQS